MEYIEFVFACYFIRYLTKRHTELKLTWLRMFSFLFLGCILFAWKTTQSSLYPCIQLETDSVIDWFIRLQFIELRMTRQIIWANRRYCYLDGYLYWNSVKKLLVAWPLRPFLESQSSRFWHFIINLWESFFSLVLRTHLIIEAVVEHRTKFLACHVGVSV